MRSVSVLSPLYPHGAAMAAVTWIIVVSVLCFDMVRVMDIHPFVEMVRQIAPLYFRHDTQRSLRRFSHLPAMMRYNTYDSATLPLTFFTRSEGTCWKVYLTVP